MFYLAPNIMTYIFRWNIESIFLRECMGVIPVLLCCSVYDRVFPQTIVRLWFC